MAFRWFSRPSRSAQPEVIHHAGMRWEVMPGGAEIVRSRADWRFDTLRREFRDTMLREKGERRFVFRMGGPECDAVVKSQVSHRFQSKLRSFYGWSKTRKEWEHHLVAFDAGVPTTRPLALGERWSRLVVQEAVVISEWRDGTATVSDWRRAKPGRVDSTATLKIAAGLGRMAALTQERGIYHNEMYIGNVLVENADEADNADDPKLLLIDWKHARLKRRTTANDLQNLRRTGWGFDTGLSDIPPTESEKRAFLTAYLDASAARPGRAKLFAQLAEDCPAAAEVYEAFLSRGRPG